MQVWDRGGGEWIEVLRKMKNVVIVKNQKTDKETVTE